VTFSYVRKLYTLPDFFPFFYLFFYFPYLYYFVLIFHVFVQNTVGSSKKSNARKVSDVAFFKTTGDAATTSAKATEVVDSYSKEESKKILSRLWALILVHWPWFCVALAGAALFSAVFPGIICLTIVIYVCLTFALPRFAFFEQALHLRHL
jgi:hypothetical protein